MGIAFVLNAERMKYNLMTIDSLYRLLLTPCSRISPQIKWFSTIAGSYYTVNGEHDFVFNVNVTGQSRYSLRL